MVREKKNSTINERLQEILKSEIFDTVFRSNALKKAELIAKIKPIGGDLVLDNLGISPEDRAMLVEDLDIIINSAASINFDDHLHDAIRINYLGTLKVFELAQQCKHL